MPMSSASLASFRSAGAFGDIDPEPSRGGTGPRCVCGKFVPHASIEYASAEDVAEGSPEMFGECKVHGRVEAIL